MTMKSINLTLPLIMTYPYFPFIRPCINPTHFKLVCCHFWCILFSYSLLHYIVLWFIMINKTLTVYVYIYIVYLFHCVVPYSIIVYRHFSHPSNIPISSAGRRQFAGESPPFKFGCASVETEPGAVEPQVLQKRPMESQKMISLSFYGDCGSIFSEGVKCAMEFGWLLSRLSCQCLYVSRPVGWNHSGAAAAPASWTDQSWSIDTFGGCR